MNPPTPPRSLIDLGPPIAAGRTAEVFAWDPGRVVKLLRDGFPAVLVDQEAQGTRAAHQAGIGAPEPGETVEIDGRRGLILERVEGPNLVQVVNRQPSRVASYTVRLGRLHAQINAASGQGLPSQRARFAWQIYQAEKLPEDLQEPLLELLEGLPDGDRLCHGDFHPENVILSRRGLVVVDWEPAMRGNPAGDVATTCLWIRSVKTYVKGAMSGLVGLVGRRMERVYLDEYRKLAPGSLDRLEDWITVKAAIRYTEDERKEADWLLGLIRKRLELVE